MVTAKVAVADALYWIDRLYEYEIPDDMASSVCPGVRVIVPFGHRNRHREGIIFQLGHNDSSRELKSVVRVLDAAPVLSKEMLSLTVWMRNRYFCTIYDAVHAILPAGLWYSVKEGFSIKDGVDKESAYDAAENSYEEEILEAMFERKGVLLADEILKMFDDHFPDRAVSSLISKGIIEPDSHIKKRTKDKCVRMLSLAVSVEEAKSYAAQIKKRAPIQASVILFLCSMERVSVSDVSTFTGASKKTVDAVVHSGIAVYSEREVFRRPVERSIERQPIPKLSQEQTDVYNGLMDLLSGNRPTASLLYGVTGSGKTAVYIHLIQEMLDRGRSTILLVPEIALTPQMIWVFSLYFGDQVALLHSSLPMGERYDEWKRICRGDARVVVGTRSAVFAPAENLGLIIIDEEHEHSYKSENEPKYHAREIAKYRCATENAHLLLGSATPDIVSMYHSLNGRYHLFTLKNRYNEKRLPSVEIVDMRQELMSGAGGEISSTLLDQLRENISRSEQSILFLNRRGTNSLVTCADCGYTYECPRCSVKLTWHGRKKLLMCHRCGFSCRVSDKCPECGGTIGFFGTGTQNVEDQLRAALPNTEILRMDADSVTAENNHEAILSRFREENIPVLLGTQMVAKGLDFENVTLVGVLSSDQLLYNSNYHASERCFSLITQVIGRSGRGDKEGRALIQTFTPGNQTIQFASRQDYDSFYSAELKMRKLQNCPPFSEIITITASSPDEAAVIRCCDSVREYLRSALAHRNDLTILGPAPYPVVRVNNRFRYRVTLQCSYDREIRNVLSEVLIFYNTDKRYRGISIYADYDPME